MAVRSQVWQRTFADTTIISRIQKKVQNLMINFTLNFQDLVSNQNNFNDMLLKKKNQTSINNSTGKKYEIFCHYTVYSDQWLG